MTNHEFGAPEVSRSRIPARAALIGSLASGIVGQGALVISGVLAARSLGPTDRGYLALLILVPTVLQLAGNLGLPLATTYFIANDRSRERSIERALRRPILLQIAVLTLLQAAILWPLVADEPRRVRFAAVLSLAILAGAMADMYGKAILQGQARYTAFNVLRNAVLALYLVGIAILFAVGQTDLVGFVVAWAAAELMAGTVTIAVARRGVSEAREDGEVVPVSRLVRFGLRGYLGSLSPVTTFRLDQAAIGLFLPPKALGLYVAALAFTNLPDIVSRGVGMIALPHVAASERDRRRAEIRSFVLFSTAMSAVIIGVLEISSGWLVPFFFGSDFEGAIGITRILLIGSFFWGIRRVLSDTASGAGRPGLASVAELFSWMAIVPLLAVLLPLWGASGVAAAISLSSAASLTALLVLLHRSLRTSQTAETSTWRSRIVERWAR